MAKPRSASGRVALPVPQPTSSSRAPGSSPAADDQLGVELVGVSRPSLVVAIGHGIEGDLEPVSVSRRVLGHGWLPEPRGLGRGIGGGARLVRLGPSRSSASAMPSVTPMPTAAPPIVSVK